MMKRLKYILAFVCVAFLFASCEEDKTYTGDSRVKLSLKKATFFVTEEGVSTHGIEVQLVGKPLDKDLKVYFEVDANKTTARNGVDYATSFETVIPAGKNLGYLDITGFFPGVSEDPAGKVLSLNLLGADGALVLKLGGVNSIALTLRQFCPFTPEDFAGEYTVSDVSVYSGALAPYDIELKLDSLTNNETMMHYTATGLWINPDAKSLPIHIVLDRTVETSVKVRIPKQKFFVDTEYGYGQTYMEEMGIGSASSCDLEIYASYKVYVAAGHFDQVKSSVWKKKK